MRLTATSNPGPTSSLRSSEQDQGHGIVSHSDESQHEQRRRFRLSSFLFRNAANNGNSSRRANSRSSESRSSNDGSRSHGSQRERREHIRPELEDIDQDLLDMINRIPAHNAKKIPRASDKAIENLMHFRLRHVKFEHDHSGNDEEPYCRPCGSSVGSDENSSCASVEASSESHDVDSDLEEPSCVVCSEAFVEGCVVSRIPCGHVYHADCLLRWLYRSCTCPTCRYELATDDPVYEIQRKIRMKEREKQLTTTSWKSLVSSSSRNGGREKTFKFVDGMGELRADDFDCLSLQIVHEGRRTIGYWHMDRRTQEQLIADLGATTACGNKGDAVTGKSKQR